MSIEPIKCGTFSFRKCDLLNNRLLFGIDSGSSTTKIVFLHRDHAAQLHDDKLDSILFQQVLFNNADFVDAVKWVHGRCYRPANDDWTLHLTGNCANKNKSVLESIFGVKVKYIDEMLTIAAGHKIALEHIGLERLMSANVDVASYGQIESKAFDKIMEGFKLRFSAEKTSDDAYKPDIFPCLIHVYGSLAGFFYFDENGVGEFASNLLSGGKSFIGLAKCLLDTNSYDEIIELASRGNRGNVDTQVKEMLDDGVDSPYGRFPPEMPMFSFGKCMDYDIGTETLTKEDLAISLVGFYAFMMVMNCSEIAKIKKTLRVYLTGNIFRSDLFKQEIQRILMMFPFIPGFEILDFGYFGALGAMLVDNDDRAKYYKF